MLIVRPFHLHFHSQLTCSLSPSLFLHCSLDVLSSSHSHNPAVDASYKALIQLRSAQLYDKAKNPLPVSFELDIIAPPLGMTTLQKDLVIGALQRQKIEQYYAEQAKKGKKADEMYVFS